jgi:EF-P beta-lysylation protein EpmB
MAKPKFTHREPCQADVAHSEPVSRWQQALREAIRTPAELCEALGLDPEAVTAFQPSAREFSMLVPRSFASRMRKGDPQDPLLLQVLPDPRERLDVVGFRQDPLDEEILARHGVLRKYAGRALLIATGACPVHCRYCFRRQFPYSEQLASRQGWTQALAELRQDPDVSEVILSGGDPLTMSNGAIAELLAEIETLEQVHTLRIHSRFPIIVPERIDHDLLDLLAKTRLATVLVVHCNHANEIDASVSTALLALRDGNTLLLNQSVLLRGVNDDVGQLERLSQALFENGVLPYYLHLLDPVAGTAHFDVPQARGRELIACLRQRLPGYLVPRLVREEPGQPSKTIVA